MWMINFIFIYIGVHKIYSEIKGGPGLETTDLGVYVSHTHNISNIKSKWGVK